MRHSIIFLLLLATVLASTSCKEIIAEDITNRTPVMIMPSVNDTVMQNPVHFKWEEMEGATKYHLQVVSPSFSTISDYVIDTIIYGTTFDMAMDSSVFELKLTAMNGGYTSQTLGPIQFWVGISPTVNTSAIVLQTPIDGAYTDATFDGPFTWQALSGANSYEYSLRKGSSFATGTIEYTQNNIVSSTFTLPASVVLTEGNYYWGVKGYFASGETYFTTRSFQVDVTDPNTPVLISPTDISFLNTGSNTFSWSIGSDGGSVHAPVHSVIEIASDAGFTNVVHTDDLIGTSVDFTLVAGNYYWRVYTYDEAGNVSAYSLVNQFSVS